MQYTSSTLSEVGKNPKERAIVMGLSTIESSFVTHTCKSIQGFNHPAYPALRVAVEVLNATEGFLWVIMCTMSDEHTLIIRSSATFVAQA